jgi:hypothetical protein
MFKLVAKHNLQLDTPIAFGAGVVGHLAISKIIQAWNQNKEKESTIESSQNLSQLSQGGRRNRID